LPPAEKRLVEKITNAGFLTSKPFMNKYSFFAEILEYPTLVLADRVGKFLPVVAASDVETARLLRRFREFLEETPAERIEEIYVGTFDLQPLCYPYIGYQLFGEEYRRGIFMALLREHYRSSGFAAGDDLPDHLCVILRFLASREPKEVERELVSDCLVPALGKMVAGFAESTHPYWGALKALLLLLEEEVGERAHTQTEG
jgi:nitrate reductase delta subunit